MADGDLLAQFDAKHGIKTTPVASAPSAPSDDLLAQFDAQQASKPQAAPAGPSLRDTLGNIADSIGYGVTNLPNLGADLIEKFAPLDRPSASTSPYGGGLGALVDNPITRGLGQAADTGAAGLNELLGRLFVAPMDYFRPGTLEAYRNRMVTPAVQAAQAQEAPSDAPLAERALQGLASLAGQVSIAGASGGGTADAQAATDAAAAAPTLAEMVANAIKAPQARLAGTLGSEAGGAQVAAQEANGQPVSNAKAASIVAANTAANLIPFGEGMPLAARIPAGVGAGVTGNALVNAANGQPLLEGALPAGTLGALLGGIAAHGEAPRAEPARAPESAPSLDDIATRMRAELKARGLSDAQIEAILNPAPEPQTAALPAPVVHVDSAGNAATQAQAEAAQRAAQSRAAELGLSPDVIAAQAMRNARAPAEAAPAAPRALPPPVVHVDASGNASTSADFMQQLRAAADALQRQRALGLTPDVQRAQAMRMERATAGLPVRDLSGMEAALAEEGRRPAEQGAPEPEPGAPAPAPEKVDAYFSHLPAEIGWEQRGGGIIRGEGSGLSEGDHAMAEDRSGPVIGRMSWIPKVGGDGRPSQFWRMRPDSRLTEAQAHEAFRKVAAGEPLRPIEQRFIDYARQTAHEYAQAEAEDTARFEAEQREADDIERQRAIEELRNENARFATTDHGEALTLAQWIRRAHDAGVPRELVGAAMNHDDWTQRLTALIREYEHGADQGTTVVGDERGVSPDRQGQATAVREGEGAPGQEGEGARATGTGSESPLDRRFSIDRGGPPNHDLFGTATSADRLRAAQEAKDAQRNGKIGGHADTGEGGLFDGERPEQTDLPQPRENSGRLFAHGEPDLIAQHNTTAEKLAHADRMGGLAVPSIGITRAGHPLQDFGNISLIGDKELVNPATGAKVFGADAYTPRYPEVKFKADQNAAVRVGKIIGTRAGERLEVEHAGTADDLTRQQAFKRYAEEQLGKDYTYHQSRALAEKVLREAGAQERIFKGFTSAGNRRYLPHTLETVVKELKRNLRGGEGHDYGPGSIRAKYTPQFRSIEAIRNAKDKIVAKADFEKLKEEVDNDFFAVHDALAPYHPFGDRFEFTDTVTQTMKDAARMGIPRAMRENGFRDVPLEAQAKLGEFLTHLRNMPTHYFEAILPRAVGIHEFKAAVIPKDTNAATRELLQRHGLTLHEYDQNVKDDQARAVREAAQARDLLFRRSAPPATHTPEQVRATLRGSPLGRAFGKLEEAGALRIESHPDQDWSGYWDGDKAVLNAARAGEEGWLGTAMHELGGHGSLHEMLGDEGFARALSDIRSLADAKGPAGDIVRRAMRRVESADTPARHRDEELLAYTISEAVREGKAWKSGALNSALVRIFNRIRAWMKTSAIGKLLAKHGVDWKLNPDDIAGLAESGIRRMAREASAPAHEPMGEPLFQRAFHGSPRRGIEQEGFKLHKIGTGEGNQAYGWGVYFASRRQIAEQYREKLSTIPTEAEERRMEAAINAAMHTGATRNEALSVAQRVRAARMDGRHVDREGRVPGTNKDAAELSAAFDAAEHAFGQEPLDRRGQLYHAEIPDDHELLDWDKPLSEQPEAVREKLREAVVNGPRRGWSSFPDRNGTPIIDPDSHETGAQMYRDLANALRPDAELAVKRGSTDLSSGARRASEYLNSIGIPGLRYLDGGSRRPNMADQALVQAMEAHHGDREAALDAAMRGIHGSPAERARIRKDYSALMDRLERRHNYVIWDEKHLNNDVTPYYSRGHDQTDTPAFRRWFGDSKVVDAQGKPLTVYHGTADGFYAFDNARLGEATAHMTAPLGHFFAEDAGKAQRYAENASKGVPADERVIDAHLSIQNPKTLSLDDLMGIESQDEARALKANLEAQGYDGIHLPEIGQWIAFDPGQIKSASENMGSFDRGNPDIRYSRPTPQDRAGEEGRGASGPGEPGSTGVKNEQVTRERAARGLDELQAEGKRSFGAVWDAAGEKLRTDPHAGQALAQHIIASPRPLKAEETALLSQDRARIIVERHAAAEDVNRAVQSGDVTGEAIARAKLQLANDQIEVNDKAARASGYEQGLGLAMRKAMAQLDYSLEGMESRLQAAKGTPLDETDLQRLKDLHVEMQANEAALAGRRDAQRGKQKETKAQLDEQLRLFKDQLDQAESRKDVARQKQLRKQIAELARRIVEGDYSKTTRTPIQYNEETKKLEAQRNFLRKKFDRMAAEAEHKNRSPAFRAWHTFLAFRRAVILSGVHTLGKLSSAALLRIGVSPVEHAVQHGLGWLPGIRGIAQRAPIEGRFSPKAEAHALKETFSKETLKEMALKFGNRGTNDLLYGKDRVSLHPWLDLVGQVHAALKTPSERNAFARSMAMLSEFEAKAAKERGLSPAEVADYLSQPDVNGYITARAYEESMRAIFKNDNKFVSALHAFQGMLRATKDGKSNLAGKAVAEFMDYLFPVQKIPTNYIGEAFSYLGGGAKALAQMHASKILKEGLDNLTPEAADYIMRNLGKQTVGAALLALGYLGYEGLGSFYQQGDNHKKHVREADSIGPVPGWLAEHPALLMLTAGANFHRIQDGIRTQTSRAMVGTGSSGDAALNTIRSLLEKTPYIYTIENLSDRFRSKQSTARYLGNEAASAVIQPDLKRYARESDTAPRRYPRGFTDAFEMNVPGLREHVPTHPQRRP